MFERGIQGGITHAVHRYGKVNNKFMGKRYDSEEESSFLQYLDASSLYGLVMSQLLPTGEFKWVMPDEITECSDKGYLLEVDVKYPKELHDLHNNFPFMCEKMEINNVEKLVPNLHDKKNCHSCKITKPSPQKWINPQKGSLLDWIWSVCMFETLHWFQHPTKDPGKEWFRKGFL